MNRVFCSFSKIAFYCFLIIIFSQNLIAQDSTSINQSSEIRITSEVDKKQVPLNRTLKLIVRVEWSGEISRYQISELEDPVINNLEIISTSSADFRTTEGGLQKAARTYEFILKPKTLGMAYIEGTMVTYVDVETGEGNTLKTNRIDVEVIESVPEPGQKKSFKSWLLFAILPILIAGIIGYFFKKKLEKKKTEEAIFPAESLEEKFLDQLHDSLSMDKLQPNISEGYYLLSRIARRYLKEKYEIDALELTTDEILENLSGKDEIDESIVNMIDEVLRTCDLAKFSGSHGDLSEYQRLYTLFESILEKNHIQAENETNAHNGDK